MQSIERSFTQLPGEDCLGYAMSFARHQVVSCTVISIQDIIRKKRVGQRLQIAQQATA